MRIIVSVALVSALVAGCKKEEAKAPAPGTTAAPATAPAPPPGVAAPGVTPPAASPPGNLGQALANLQQLGQQMAGNQAPGAVNPQNNPGAALGQAMAQLGQLGKAMGGGGATGPVVNWKALEPFAPEKLGDWTSSSQLTGDSTNAMGMQVSRVQRRYKKGDASLSLEIVDTSASPFMRMGVNMAANFNMDGTDGVKRGVTLNNSKGLLEWSRNGNNGKLTLLVGDRFLVNMRVNPAASADEVLAVGNLLDASGLAAVEVRSAI